jgi:hypothetical protein
VSTIVAHAPRLPALLRQPPRPVLSLPPFGSRIDAAIAHGAVKRKYHAELVWMRFLRALDVSPHFWRFCTVARFRVGLADADSAHADGAALLVPAARRCDARGVGASEPSVAPDSCASSPQAVTVRRVTLHSCGGNS